MKIGAHLMNGEPWASASTIVPVGDRAEALGYDSLWVSDHVVIPIQIESQYPYGPRGAFTAENRANYFEPFGVLAFLAGRTSRIQLGTTVLVLPQRTPLLVAKQWATLDALSGGRTILGVGAGWMREEFEALGMDTFERRGPATDEAIKIYREAWTKQGDVSYEGEVYSFAPVRVLPKPAQRNGPPIWVGGHSRRAIRRTAELGDGWHCVRIDLPELKAGVATLREMLDRYGRQRSEVVVSNVVPMYAPDAQPSGEPRDSDIFGDAEQMAARVRAYQEAGVEHLVVNPGVNGPDRLLEALEFFASDVRPLLS